MEIIIDVHLCASRVLTISETYANTNKTSVIPIVIHVQKAMRSPKVFPELTSVEYEPAPMKIAA